MYARLPYFYVPYDAYVSVWLSVCACEWMFVQVFFTYYDENYVRIYYMKYVFFFFTSYKTLWWKLRAYILHQIRIFFFLLLHTKHVYSLSFSTCTRTSHAHHKENALPRIITVLWQSRDACHTPLYCNYRLILQASHTAFSKTISQSDALPCQLTPE